jgi:large subunit ribosomal protein L3
LKDSRKGVARRAKTLVNRIGEREGVRDYLTGIHHKLYQPYLLIRSEIFCHCCGKEFLTFCYLKQNCMKFIIGYKQEMTQLFRDDGTIVPVTLVEAEPCVVTQVKREEPDGYESVQLGVGEKKHVGKTIAGQIAGVLATGRKPFLRMREIRLEDASAFKVGDLISAQGFQAGDKIQVVGTSKGKGFQGVVKRHHFHGQPATRGTKDQERMPGSIASKRQGAVRKGQRMAGRMGGDRVTVKNLEIVKVEPEKNLLYIKGAIPGARHAMVIITGDGVIQASGNMLVKTEATAAPAQTEAQAPAAK